MKAIVKCQCFRDFIAARWTAVCCLLAFGLGAPALSWIGVSRTYDDWRFLSVFKKSPLWGCLAPFRFEVAYWRPLGTLSMCAPFWASPWIGFDYAYMASKSISVLLMVAAACLGVMAVSRGGRLNEVSMGGRAAVALLVSSVLFSLSPVLAESEMWWSDRFDALLVVILMGILHRASCPPASSAKLGEAVLWGLALCLAKETGALWAGAMAVLLWTNASSRNWSAGFAVSLSIYFPVRSAVVKWWPSQNELIPGSLPGDWEPKTGVNFAWSFLESLGRQATMLAWPTYDMDPSHSERGGPWWIYGLGGVVVVLIVLAFAKHIRRCFRGEAVWWSAWCCAAGAMMVLGAAKGAATMYPGELFSTQLAPARYLAPSAMVLWVAAGTWLVASRPSLRARVGLLAFCVSAILCLPVGWRARAEWADDLAVKEAAVREGLPNSWSVGGLAMVLVDLGEDARAQKMAVDWIERSPDKIPMCELWDIAEAGPEKLGAGVSALIQRRRLSRPPCPEWISAAKSARGAGLSP